MKFKKILILALAAGTMLPLGCKKGFFDQVPDNILSIDGIFSNRAQTENWLGGLYTNIHDPWAQRYNYWFSVTTDELDISNWANPAMNNGAISPSSVNMESLGYTKQIRNATIFIENVGKNQEILSANDSRLIIRQYEGEAQFLRAYYYWMLMKQYGPTVILPTKLGTLNDNYQIPRSSWDECVDFVIKEIDEATAKLTVDNYTIGTAELNPARVGRINQMIALAVKAEILLYHASPLFNGNIELANFKNLDGKQLFNQTYDATRWKKAADAAKAAIAMAEANGKKLYTVADNNPFKAAFLACRNLYWDGWKTEGVWIRTGNNYAEWENHAAPRSVQGTAFNGMAVMQELVDDFRMANGNTIENSSTYAENAYASTNTEYYVTGTNSMYMDREPRFYVDVTFNGSKIPAVPKSGQTRVEYYFTGNSGKAGETRNWPKTGYTARKNINPNYSMNPYTTVARPAMLIRMADLYLEYAEALNESDPSNPDVLAYLNKVRTRGGIPVLTGGSQSEIRDEIRRERRIELCFENGARYFDVRRWKLVDKPGFTQGGQYHGMNIDAGSSLSDPAFHQRTVAFTRAVWQRKYYFFPYGQDEMDRNKQLVQFPGY